MTELTHDQRRQLASELTTDMLDGRSFGSACPASHRDDLKNTLPTVFEVLVDRYPTDLEAVVAGRTPEEVGLAFAEEWDRICRRDGGRDAGYAYSKDGSATLTEIGRFIKQSVADYYAKVERSPVNRTALYPMPNWRLLTANWDLTGPALTRWALDGTNDLKRSVDEQIVHLRDAGVIGGVALSSFGSNADEKVFVGDLMRHKATLLFTVGSKWVVHPEQAARISGPEGGCGFPSAYGTEPFPITVHHIDPGTDTQTLRIHVAFNATPDVDNQYQRDRAADGSWYVLPHHLTAITDSEETAMPDTTTDTTVLPDEVTAETVADLRTQVATLTTREEQATRRYLGIKAEADTIIEAIFEQAEKRGWCSEYESDFAQPLNEQLRYLELPVREKEFDVEWDETYLVTVRRSHRVTARDADAAIDEARDYESSSTADSDELLDAIRSGNVEHQDSSDFLAEEV